MRTYILCFIIFIWSSSAIARNPYVDSLNKRQEAKKKTRWTLADWFETKEKVRLMDMWLALNYSANLFELYLEGSQFSYDIKTLSGVPPSILDGERTHYGLGAFVSVFGLSGSYVTEDQIKITDAALHLRLLGAAQQSTNLTLTYGLRQVDDPSFMKKYDTTFYAGSLRIYIFNFFGIFGEYKRIQEVDRPDGIAVKGVDLEYGGFFDIGILQIFGNWLDSTSEFSSGQKEQKQGLNLGARVYF